MFSHKFRFLFILGLTFYSFFNAWISGLFDNYQIPLNTRYVCLAIFVITFFLWESNRILENNHPKLTFKNLHPLLIRFSLSLFTTGIICYLTVLFIGHFFLNLPEKSYDLALRLSLLFGYRINLFLNGINTIIFYFDQYRIKKIEAESLKRANMQAELQVIRSQINPHFLFNNLNVLSSLVLTRNQDANQFIEEFAEVYRYILKYHSEDLVDLRSELEFSKHYLFLLEKRFASGLEVNIDIPDRYLDYRLVPVALQMLIENATKHNIIASNKPLKIDIKILENPFRLSLSNNIQKKIVQEVSEHIGLKNINERFKLVTGKSIHITDNLEFFCVEIPLVVPLSNSIINPKPMNTLNHSFHEFINY